MNLDAYTRADADPTVLAGSTVAVIGYGNLGSSMARNLAASGLTVVVGNRDDEFRDAGCRRRLRGGGHRRGRGPRRPRLRVDLRRVDPGVLRPRRRPGAAAWCGGVLRVRVLPRLRVGDPAARRRRPPPCPAHGRHRRRARRRVGVRGLRQRRARRVRSGPGAPARPRPRRRGARSRSLRRLGRRRGGARPVRRASGRAARRVGDPARLRGRCLGRSGARDARCSSCTSPARWPRSSAASPSAASTRPSPSTGPPPSTAVTCARSSLDTDAMRAHFAAVLDDIRRGGFAEKFQAEEAAGSPALSLIAAVTAGDDPITRAEQMVRAAIGGVQQPAHPDPSVSGQSSATW